MAEDDVIMTIDDGGLAMMLDSMIRKVKNLRPLLKQFQVLMIRSLDLNFRYEGRPRKWAPLQKATMKRKRSTGILKDTGRLRLSVSMETARGNITRFTSDSLKMGTSIPYAKFLQEGTKHMPARPFVIIQNEDAEQMEILTGSYLLE